MAKICFALLMSFLSTRALSSDVQIIEVGLKGYYSISVSVPVVVEVKAPESTSSLLLEFTVSLDARKNFGPSRVDHFSRQADVKPGENNRIVSFVPLFPSGLGHSTLDVNVSDASGHHLGSASINLDSLTKLTSETLVALYCTDRSVCDEAQSQISFSGSEEDVASKNQSFKFVTLQSARQSYLDYAPARDVVVAGPISEWNSDERFALEAYARRGGNLFLLEKESADKDFLAAYRSDDAARATTIGKGTVHWIASLKSQNLGTWFAGKSLKSNNPPVEAFDVPTADQLRRLLAMSFDFPRLRWFLTWMAVYIFIVGLGNFALLRRFRRLEWGWLTTSAIAVAFAVGLYFVSSSNRPRHVTLDDIAVYWMDSKSPVAWTSVGLRVSSPERQPLQVSVGDDAILASTMPANSGDTNVDIAMDITREDRVQPGWEVKLGPPVQVALSLLRWSFADLDFQTFHKFPGTVTVTPVLHVTNATGQQFREAMYLDYSQNRKYVIPGLSPGQEIDLNTISWSPIWVRRQVTSGDTAFEVNQEAGEISAKRHEQLKLENLPYNLFRSSRSHVFVGLSDEPVPPASVQNLSFDQKRFAITVVAMDQP